MEPINKANLHSFVVSLSFLSGLHCIKFMSETTSWFSNIIICFLLLSFPYHNAGTVWQIPTLLRYLKQTYRLVFALV